LGETLMTTIYRVLFILFLVLPVPMTWSADLFHTSDFEDGTLDGWAGGASPTRIPTGGPQGSDDAYLLLTSNGANGPGSKLATLNNASEWTGDYAAAGIQRIAVDMANFSMSPLDMRVVLFGPTDPALRWASAAAHIVPTGSDWDTYEFFLFESEMAQVAGAIPYVDLIQDVLRVMIRFDPGGPSPDGSAIAAQLGIDNVRLLPGGDFDHDGMVAASDVDALVAAIAGNNDPAEFDLNGDNLVNGDDLEEWLRMGGNVNLGPGQSYLRGDATLDGVVDGQDFIAWNGNKFSSTAAWTSGDFNADGVVDGQDFILWNGNKFTTSDFTSAVPEPAAWLMLVAACFVFSLRSGCV
jgi:hypothetical protein